MQGKTMRLSWCRSQDAELAKLPLAPCMHSSAILCRVIACYYLFTRHGYRRRLLLLLLVQLVQMLSMLLILSKKPWQHASEKSQPFCRLCAVCAENGSWNLVSPQRYAVIPKPNPAAAPPRCAAQATEGMWALKRKPRKFEAKAMSES